MACKHQLNYHMNYKIVTWKDNLGHIDIYFGVHVYDPHIFSSSEYVSTPLLHAMVMFIIFVSSLKVI